MTLRRHLRTLALLASLPLAGCYTYSTGLSDKPAPGTEVSVTLNDRGRVALEQALGPEVWQVDGKVVNADDSSLELSIAKVSTLEHATTPWAGESVTLRSEYFRSVTERRFSPGRTVIAATVATAGVVAFFATRSLLGLGSLGGGPNDGGGGGTGGQ